MKTTADVIVVGCGGFGASALYYLADRGLSVIGVDQYSPPHQQGSSHGETRMIRKAYFEHPDYVPLLQRAYTLWHDLAAAQSVDLYVQTGLLLFGPEHGEVIAGARQSAQQHGLALESVSRQDYGHRFPQFHVPEDLSCVFEREAGYLKVERCVETYLKAAQQAGQSHGKPVRFVRDRRVLSVSGSGESAKVVLDDGTNLSSSAVVICAGPWTGELLPDYARWISLKRKMQFWYPLQPETAKTWADSPAFLFDMPKGCFYGFPSTDRSTLKVCEHSGGLSIPHPTAAMQPVMDSETQSVEEFVADVLRGVDSKAARSRTCIYSMSPDSHFLLDHLPDSSFVVAAGFSGHGFKFTSVIGEAIADLVTTGSSRQPISFLSRNRLRKD